MASTRFFLDLRGKAKDGKGSVLIYLYHNGTTTTIKTGIRVSKDNWNDNKVVHIVGAEAINANLQEQKSKVDKSIALLMIEDDFDSLTASEIKKRISVDKKQKNSGHLISELFEEYINTGNLKQGTKEIYRSTLKKVITFSGSDMKIECLFLKWLRQFDMFLSKTQGINGKAIFLRSLRAVNNYARHNGIDCPYPFENFQIKQEPTRNRNVEVTMLREFMYFQTTESNEKYRDYFFLMFYLIGINSKDLFLAKKSQVIKGRLVYIREKTHKEYSIKIEPEAKKLIEKYKGKGEYLLEIMDRCKTYRSYAHEMNDALKTIGRTIREEIPNQDNLFGEPEIKYRISPIIPGISTYYARHTWATLAHEIGISSDIIAMALGHSQPNRTTFIYIKPDRKKVDEANRKVIDYLLNRS